MGVGPPIGIGHYGPMCGLLKVVLPQVVREVLQSNLGRVSLWALYEVYKRTLTLEVEYIAQGYLGHYKLRMFYKSTAF